MADLLIQSQHFININHTAPLDCSSAGARLLRQKASKPNITPHKDYYLIWDKKTWDEWLHINNFKKDHPKEASGFKIHILEDK